jgi:hypothetical protein
MRHQQIGLLDHSLDFSKEDFVPSPPVVDIDDLSFNDGIFQTCAPRNPYILCIDLWAPYFS